jgi:hypothetical protein
MASLENRQILFYGQTALNSLASDVTVVVSTQQCLFRILEVPGS